MKYEDFISRFEKRKKPSLGRWCDAPPTRTDRRRFTFARQVMVVCCLSALADAPQNRSWRRLD